MAGENLIHPLGDQPPQPDPTTGGGSPRPVNTPPPELPVPALSPTPGDYAVCWLDLNGRITRWSPACEALFARESSEAIGLHLRDLFTEDDQDRGYPELTLSAARESGTWDSVGWRTAPSVGRFWSASSTTLVRTPNGVEVGFMVVTRDLTPLAADLSGVVSPDAARLTAIGRVATDVAHDLGNILTAIRGFAGLLERYLPKTGASHQVWYELLKACDRGTNLTARLLGVGCDPDDAARSVDVARVVREVEPLLRQVLPNRILMVVSLEDDLPQVTARASDLELVLLNLVVNARDAIAGEGTIAVTAARVAGPAAAGDERVVLSVRDSGSGMAAEVQERAFERFFTTKESDGSGVGLALVRDAVRSSGGWVEIDSKPGSGTAVQVVLSVANDCMTNHSAFAELPPRVETRNGLGRVLVCCHCGVFGGCVVDLLRRGGFEVLEARDITLAKELYAEAGDVDVILMDLSLSRAPGPALVEELRGTSEGLRAIYFASQRGVGDAIPVIPPGDRMLSEPFSPDELLGVVRDLVGGDDERAARAIH